MDGCQSWKLALETSANFVATRAGNSRWNPARVSGKCVMSIRLPTGRGPYEWSAPVRLSCSL